MQNDSGENMFHRAGTMPRRITVVSSKKSHFQSNASNRDRVNLTNSDRFEKKTFDEREHQYDRLVTKADKDHFSSEVSVASKQDQNITRNADVENTDHKKNNLEFKLTKKGKTIESDALKEQLNLINT